MTPNEYQDLAARTDQDRTHQVVDKIIDMAPNGSWLLHSLIGLSGETGELAAAIQRWLYYGKELDKTNVVEELGDLCWYLAQACRSIGIQLETVMYANIRKLKFRYPERYTDFHAAEENRDRGGEEKVIYQQVEESRCQRVVDGDLAMQKEFPILMSAKDFIATQTGPKEYKLSQCPSCKTPYSDRAPNYCPNCGKAQTILA